MSVDVWEKKAEAPLSLLALAFLVAYAWPILDPRVDPTVRNVLNAATWTVWVAFAVDLAVRLWLAEDRFHYALRHWYDVALVVVPMLRPLRLLRLIALVRILDRSATSSLVGRTAVYLTGAASAAVGLGSLAVLDAERGAPGANITSFGDAVWWACETVTTVGYGDRYPVTFQGRVVAVVLMIVGIGLIGTVTATVAATILKRIETDEDKQDRTGSPEPRGLAPDDRTRPVTDPAEVERVMALVEKGQHLGGHHPDTDAMDRARRVLTGEITEVQADAEIRVKFGLDQSPGSRS